MIKAAVIGWPVSHSLSPKLHGYWLKQYGIDGGYEAIEVKSEDLETCIKSLAQKGFAGCNLTIPHKERALHLLDHIDKTAQAIGAVNAIMVKEGKLHGTNTDAYGFAQNVRDNAQFATNKAVVLGAGGAARAVCKALSDMGFKDIVITNRTIDKAEQLAKQFGAAFTPSMWDKRSDILENTDLLVNTTSLGLEKNPPLEIDLAALPKQAVVSDIVYVPLETPLLREAKSRGYQTVDGLGMLIHQAVPCFEAWFGKRPQVTDALKTYLLGFL